MNPIQVKSLLDAKRVTETKLCEILFPDVKYPKHALKRLLASTSRLDEVQMKRLALHLKCDIDDLYKLHTWTSKPHKLGVIVLEKDGNRALLDASRGTATVYFADAEESEVILFTSTTTVSQLINQLTKTVNRYERSKN